MDESARQVIVVIALLGAATIGLASNSGDPGTMHGGPAVLVPSRAPSPLLTSLDDTLQPVTSRAVASTAPAPVKDTANGTAVKRRSAAARLQALSRGERANARLSLEPTGRLREAERQQAKQVELLWADGRFEEAIGLLAQLEAGGATFAVGIAWRQPVVSQQEKVYTDVRIGGARVGAEDVALDFDRGSGNLFAVVQWAPGTEDVTTVNISTDGGASWAETYAYSHATSVVDAAVVDQYLYMAYSGPDSVGEARMRRFFVADGTSDSGYGYQTVAHVAPATVTDISAGTNADEHDNRIYCAFIQSDHQLRFFWDVASDGTTWSENSPSVANAQAGLDYHWAKGYSTAPLWLSFLATDGAIHALASNVSAVWTDYVTNASPSGFHAWTSVSAYGDNVFVAYEDAGTGGNGIHYNVSYNAGSSWDDGWAYNPGAGEPQAACGDITARSGLGTAVVFNLEEGEPDHAYLTTRAGYAAGGWTSPAAYSDLDVLTGTRTVIQYMGTSCLMSYGMVYISSDGNAPYFDLSSERALFCDGFESGTTGSWSATVP